MRTPRGPSGGGRSGRVEAVLVGRALRLPADGTGSPVDRPWFTAIHKSDVAGRARVGRDGLAGDEQADTLRHGGPDKAVLLFAIGHYSGIAAGWSLDLVPGAFGENLLISGLDERSVCIGDRWRIGTSELRVTQPRQPAWKIARRWHRSRLPKALAAEAATGWYARVGVEGEVWRGAPATLIERPMPEWSVQLAVEVLYARRGDPQTAARLMAAPLLAESWKHKIATRYRELGRQS